MEDGNPRERRPYPRHERPSDAFRILGGGFLAALVAIALIAFLIALVPPPLHIWAVGIVVLLWFIGTGVALFRELERRKRRRP